MDSTVINCKPILKSALFSTLFNNDQDIVVSCSSFLHLRKGGILFSAGQEAVRFFLLLEGDVKIYKIDTDGKESEIARFTGGDFIGEFDFARSAKYDAFAKAEKDSKLIIFPAYGKLMDQLTLENPHTVSKILLCSIEMMTNRIKSTQKIVMENMSWIQELHRKAYEDPDTGLWKQVFITDEISRILEKPTALILLKPDRFKILVDSRGHGAGDEAMIHIALALKNITRRLGRGWPIRFRSNETGLLINKCNATEAEILATDLYKAISALPPVPAVDGHPEFPFSGTVVWGVWPTDSKSWESLLEDANKLLLDTWRDGGNRIVHFTGANT